MRAGLLTGGVVPVELVELVGPGNTDVSGLMNPTNPTTQLNADGQFRTRLASVRQFALPDVTSPTPAAGTTSRTRVGNAAAAGTAMRMIPM